MRPLWMGGMISAIFSIFGLSFMVTMHFRSSSSYLHYLQPLSINTSAPSAAQLEADFTALEELVLNKSQECSAQSVYYYNTRAAVNALDVTKLTTLVTAVVSQCMGAINTIQEKIALVASLPQHNNHTILHAETGYELRQLVLGTQLKIVYLYLFPWSNPEVVTSTSIIYTLFVPDDDSCTDGVRPLLPVQSAKFVGTNVTVESYQLNCSNNTLVFFTNGVGGTIQLMEALVIYAWFL